MKISIKVDGKIYHGSYLVEEDDILTVLQRPDWKRKSTQLGSSSPESLARIMLREMVEPRQP